MVLKKYAHGHPLLAFLLSQMTSTRHLFSARLVVNPLNPLALENGF